MKNIINIVCIKWGDAYGVDYVNKLYSMITRNTTYEIHFYCFTDNPEDLNKNVIVKPLPRLNTIKEYQTKYSYRKEAALCDDELGGLNNKRVFFFDLDMVIVSNLDDLFNFVEGQKFYIINDWNHRGNNVGQASCYSWVVGTLGYIKEYYEKHPKEVTEKYFTASQEYLSSKVIEKYGQLNFWPEDWFCSFKFHCMQKIGPLRHFFTPKIPENKKGLKVIAFHGNPNPAEAIKGIWQDKKNRKWKKLYKVCLPTKWIEEYWN